MPFCPLRFRHYALELSAAMYALAQETREAEMSAQNITGLADTIRAARLALAGVPAVADELKATAASVLAKVKQVQALTGELKTADAELSAAIGQLSNGAPPLEDMETEKVSVAPSVPIAVSAGAIHISSAQPVNELPVTPYGTVVGLLPDTGSIERSNLSSIPPQGG